MMDRDREREWRVGGGGGGSMRDLGKRRRHGCVVDQTDSNWCCWFEIIKLIFC